MTHLQRRFALSDVACTVRRILHDLEHLRELLRDLGSMSHKEKCEIAEEIVGA